MKRILVALTATVVVAATTVSVVQATSAGCCPTAPPRHLPFTGPEPTVQGTPLILGTVLTPKSVVGGQTTPDPNAFGIFSYDWKPKTRKLTWLLEARGFSTPAYAVTIHLGGKGETGPLLVLLCSPCDAERKKPGRIEGIVYLTAEQASLGGRPQYIDVHTAANPRGEIRGQIP